MEDRERRGKAGEKRECQRDDEERREEGMKKRKERMDTRSRMKRKWNNGDKIEYG